MSVSIATLGMFSPASSGTGGGGIPYPVEIEKPKPTILADFVGVKSLGDSSFDFNIVRVKSITTKSEDHKIGITSVRITQ